MEKPTPFKPGCLPALIGSLPVKDHEEAVDLVAGHTPDVPIWIQLPMYRQEGMLNQFVSGVPGLVDTGDKVYVDTSSQEFEEGLMAFYEEYLAVTEAGQPLEESRFAMKPEHAPGFFALKNRLETAWPQEFSAIKGQVTGPFTLATTLMDQDGRAALYDDRLRDVVVKILALKARWQAKVLGAFGKQVLIFLDEPALAGFGSSAFLSVTKEDIAALFEEIMEAIHQEGALVGVHICANSDWSLVLDSPADIVSFDQYEVFEQFVMYKKDLKAFFDAGKIVAWGIVPTIDKELVMGEFAESLEARWQTDMKQVEALGIDRATLLSQSLITPSCGTGSLDLEASLRVLELTQEVSNMIRYKEQL
ncbi:conserved hypothetical protein [Desulfatibacillum aliphaticivorans]|uniref:Methionine synthase vitamin-B12 independent n=1 Tax=Desulfatibacillum aliphaticivorans TaxID=218208 RepID=B8FE83_DESAL|nr:hypothetical protein [Desulfatibacillum aliphaticivorans]ACL06864.1 conserved hypothetical protein [Desulfatibacillum aliphaticivorans]